MEKWGLKFGKIVPKVKARDVVGKWKIFTGDTVQIINGAETGLVGKVECVLRKRNQVVVSGANIAKVNVVPRNGVEKGYYLVEKGINVSNVALVDPVTKRPTKVFWRILEDGKKIRVAKDSGVEIPKPPGPQIVRQSGPFDTNPEDALRRTFFPSLLIPPFPEDCSHI